jgi:L-histidine N-alpha-methyltransferase
MTVQVAAARHMPIRTLLLPTDRRRSMVADVNQGLVRAPRSLPPKYFYDDRGSELFDAITRLPEYYPTRAERALLEASADDIVYASDARVLLELGSGSSEKTAVLLDAFDRLRHLEAYVPVDVSEGALRGALSNLALTRPSLPVFPVVADFERHLAVLPAPGRRMVAFLGSTIGNFTPAQRAAFFSRLSFALKPGETVLIGIDLVKDPARLVAAYDDSAGVTAEFNRNVLHVLNRELAGDFVPDDFEHVAIWDAEHEWIDIRLRAERASAVTLRRAGLSFELDAGEEIRTEISAKFRRPTIESELVAAGFRPIGWWSDGDYALALARN